MELTYLQKQRAQEVIGVMLKKINTDDKAAATSFEELKQDLSPQSQKFASKLNTLQPDNFGVSRHRTKTRRSNDMVVVRNQTYQTRDGVHEIPPRLVPRSTYRAFHAMNHSLKKDTGRELVIQSGHRTPAYQLFVFLFQLRSNNWNFKKTIKSVALPGYSEHADGHKQALDLRTRTFIGPHDMYDFSRTADYTWLKSNAHKFGFSLSYPKENNTGTQFEPWHWRHK